MCQCSTHSNEDVHDTAAQPGAVTLMVEDMTCGHCASTVKDAIETSLTGTRVDADPAACRVTVTGSTDLERIREVVRSAGYTPVDLPVT